MSMMMIMM